MRTQFAGEESCGRPLRDGDRDEVVLRSHQIHRGLRGCGPLQSSKEHRSWPGVHRRSPTATAVMAPLSHDGSRPHGSPCPSIPHRRPIRIMSMTNALVGADLMAALPSRAYPRTSGQPGFHGTSLEGGREEGMGACTAPLDVARRNELRPSRRECRPGNLPRPPAPSPETSHHGRPRQGTVSTSVCLNSSAVARMGTL